MTAKGRGRNTMDGIIVVDKPPDMTSAKLVSRVKRLLKANKVGHAGTLDPFATGVMICLINRGTRLAEFFLHGEKAYDATLCLGVETDTQDFTGTVLQARDVRPEDYSKTDIISVFRAFEGDSQQVPPCFSALKHEGKPLYQYARKGIRVEKPPRSIHLSALEPKEIDLPFVRFSVRCSGGTYIRTLCHDIGRRLGCGGHLTALRRIEAGGFSVSDVMTLDEVEKQVANGQASDLLVSLSDALWHMPAYVADDNLAAFVAHGRQLTDDAFPDGVTADPRGAFKLVDKEGRLLAVIRRQEGAFRYGCVFSG